MDVTRSYVKVYNFSPEAAEDFEFEFTTDDSEMLQELDALKSRLDQVA